MIRILSITLSALMLASCADSRDRSAGITDCKPAASADHPAPNALFGNNLSSNNSLGGLPGRDLPIGSSRHLPHDTSAHKCLPDSDNNGKEPQTGDLQKIGEARSLGIKSRPV